MFQLYQKYKEDVYHFYLTPLNIKKYDVYFSLLLFPLTFALFYQDNSITFTIFLMVILILIYLVVSAAIQKQFCRPEILSKITDLQYDSLVSESTKKWLESIASRVKYKNNKISQRYILSEYNWTYNPQFTFIQMAYIEIFGKHLDKEANWNQFKILFAPSWISFLLLLLLPIVYLLGADTPKINLNYLAITLILWIIFSILLILAQTNYLKKYHNIYCFQHIRKRKDTVFVKNYFNEDTIIFPTEIKNILKADPYNIEEIGNMATKKGKTKRINSAAVINAWIFGVSLLYLEFINILSKQVSVNYTITDIINIIT